MPVEVTTSEVVVANSVQTQVATLTDTVAKPAGAVAEISGQEQSMNLDCAIGAIRRVTFLPEGREPEVWGKKKLDWRESCSQRQHKQG